jgi:hypothetical protein
MLVTERFSGRQLYSRGRTYANRNVWADSIGQFSPASPKARA